MKRLMLAVTAGLLAISAFAGPVSASREFGSIYANDLVYRTFGNPSHVADGAGTDPFAIFTNSEAENQFGVAEFAPGIIGHHGARWAIYHATWTNGDPTTRVTSWSDLETRAANDELVLARDEAADFRCPVLGNPTAIPGA
jgi:hypothetical protein